VFSLDGFDLFTRRCRGLRGDRKAGTCLQTLAFD